MTGTSLDMTAPRPDGASPVFAVYGDPDPAALTLTAMREHGTILVPVPPSTLLALETGSAALRDAALEPLRRHQGMDLLGAVGFDDWWTTALGVLNEYFPLADARTLVTDKALLYRELCKHDVYTADFQVGSLSKGFLADALEQFGPRPVLKPSTGAGSRGVYRYRDDLTIEDNLALYHQLLRLGHIDSAVPIIAAEYLGGDAALEISVEIVLSDSRIAATVVHEKLSATHAHPFVDHVMISPPADPGIVAALPQLPPALAGVAATLGIADGALHVELRLDEGEWFVLDIGVRPGAGLVAHATHARTGVDPRRIHLGACLGRPVPAPAIIDAVPDHDATAIACCYVTPHSRAQLRLKRHSDLADRLRTDPAVLGWHLNVAEVADEVYRPDAGLSLGVGAPDTVTALRRLRSLAGPYAFTTD